MRLSTRARLVSFAITFATVCAVSLLLGLIAFLREVISATGALRIVSSPHPLGKPLSKQSLPLVEE